MRLLNRNHYGIWYSDRCNYGCSYCCNKASAGAPKSAVETNLQALINCLGSAEPGLISVSGGEPTLWKDLPVLFDALPQHGWILFTNLSFLPNWIEHPQIKLIVPAYHEEYAQEDKFSEHLTRLKQMGKRLHVKIIVKPEQEYHQVGRWEKWNAQGIPASFTPLEYTYYFKSDFIRDLIYKYRTCSLYNARFFRSEAAFGQVCCAGTSQAFQVMPDGRLVRCSTVAQGLGEDQLATIGQPRFNASAQPCDLAASCYCEWHHWGGMAPANDNAAWTKYIDTGVWETPTLDDLYQFVLDMNWNPSGRTMEKTTHSLFPALTLRERCEHLEKNLPVTSPATFKEFGLLEGHPWAKAAQDPITNYYDCLSCLVKPEHARRILEVGTAFGMSAATLLKASPSVESFVSLDLGIYGQQLGDAENNIEFARRRLQVWCQSVGMPERRVQLYRANTQPPGKGDNQDAGSAVPQWYRLSQVLRRLEADLCDVIFVDGKHTDDGLFNDLNTFWPFLKPDGLMICDDLHDPVEYAGTFDWVGHTWQSFHRFLETHSAEIADHFIWNFPQVSPGGKLGLRPFGLLRKTSTQYPRLRSPGFEVFDSEGASQINRARQDHLASLGVDLARQSVLEVGAGVGWHTAFFEKLGCNIISTDARPENVQEHIARYPYRKDRVYAADLDSPNSHARFGKVDIVYCYGTLYHLHNPAGCIRELASQCARLFLLETVVNPEDAGPVVFEQEDLSNPNQSFHGIGCRPTRPWIMAELSKYFPYVYHTVTQPDFPDYKLEWPPALNLESGSQDNCRAVFVASRLPLNLPTLSPVLVDKQIRLPSLSDHFAPAAPPPAVESAVCSQNGSALSAEEVSLRERLGRMLNHPQALSAQELQMGADMLQLLLAAPDPAQFIEARRGAFHSAMLPLLITNLAKAWQADNQPVAELLERLYGLLTTITTYTSARPSAAPAQALPPTPAKRLAPPMLRPATAARPYFYLGDHLALTQTLFGHRFYVDTRDVQLTPQLLLDGVWEPNVTQVFAQVVKAGMTVVDIGANVGYFSVLAGALAGPQGKVIGFEANPEAFAVLVRNMEVNGLAPRSQLVNCGVMDRSGDQLFVRFKNHPAGSALCFDEKQLPGSQAFAAEIHDTIETITIPCVSLDDYFAEHPARVDVIKIDAEGAEPQILAGALKFLQQNPNLQILIEYSPSNRAAFETLAGLGFHQWLIDAEGALKPFPLGDLLPWPEMAMLYLTRG